jgi:hypothetical protein
VKDKVAALGFMRSQLEFEKRNLTHHLKMVEMFPATTWAVDMHKEAAWTQLRIEHYADAIEALEQPCEESCPNEAPTT